MNKKELTEADVRTKFITPALVAPVGKWDVMTQLREEVYFTNGRVERVQRDFSVPRSIAARHRSAMVVMLVNNQTRGEVWP